MEQLRQKLEVLKAELNRKTTEYQQLSVKMNSLHQDIDNLKREISKIEFQLR